MTSEQSTGIPPRSIDGVIACPPFAFEKFNTRFTKRCSRDEIVIVENRHSRREKSVALHAPRGRGSESVLDGSNGGRERPSTPRNRPPLDAARDAVPAIVHRHQPHAVEGHFTTRVNGVLCILKRIKKARTTVVKAIRATSFWSVSGSARNGALAPCWQTFVVVSPMFSYREQSHSELFPTAIRASVSTRIGYCDSSVAIQTRYWLVSSSGCRGKLFDIFLEWGRTPS